MSDVSRSLLVTGMQRSGTTLLDKLLSHHPQVSVLSQPFPLLFVEVKRAFLAGHGVNDAPYPLGDFGAEDLESFLTTLRLDAGWVGSLFAGMETYSGQYSKPTAERLSRALAELATGDLAAVVSHLWRRLADRPGAAIYGGKETLTEEFLPHLLGRGGKGIIVVRDPRDVIASLNHGEGARYGGAPKPVLFNVRNWRKSVAFALHLEGPAFVWIRYEDLVLHPVATLDRVARWLGVAALGEGWVAGGIRDERGLPWTGNSSHHVHHGLSTASLGIHRRLLPATVAAFVEATCLAELALLGYPVEMSGEDARAVVDGFVDPYPPARPELARFASDRALREEEQRRLQSLVPGADAAAELFPFADVRNRLQATGAVQ